MDCLLCRFPESDYKPETEKEFICSKCVQHFLSVDQTELMRAYNKAIEKGYPDKAIAIKSFLIPEGQDHEQRKPKSKFRININRKRINRTIGNKEKRIGRSKVPAPDALL